MTLIKFKELLEQNNVKDEDEISYIDISYNEEIHFEAGEDGWEIWS